MMDDVDRKIVALLRRDARMSVVALSQRLKLGRAAVATRLDRMVRRGPITGFTVLLEGEAEAMPVCGMLTVEIEGKGTAAVIDTLDRLVEIRAIHTTNGRWDLVCEVATTSLPALDALLQRVRMIPGVSNSETSLYLRTRRSQRPPPVSRPG